MRKLRARLRRLVSLWIGTFDIDTETTLLEVWPGSFGIFRPVDTSAPKKSP